jgi:nucleotide-binding universal stress UspA family protein
LDPEPKYVVGIDLLPEGILSAASQFNADLIVMGANRKTSGRVAAHLPWTAVHHVIHDALCPVLTVSG